ncbi:hypothetical protein EYF80_055118 [Liparis tanakae]|uniref:Uncharacterized protein n=1 Tax=Liparis tanakae TaxID=230148 RepID=A0A4Z2F111_9TELE|nr:hypothetical protein EYF80_055118 [Liparis tanakae]
MVYRCGERTLLDPTSVNIRTHGVALHLEARVGVQEASGTREEEGGILTVVFIGPANLSQPDDTALGVL